MTVVAPAEVHKRACRAIHPQRGIAINQCHCASRFSLEQEAARNDAVTADVVQRATAKCRLGCGCRWDRHCKEKNTWIARSSPILPLRTNSRARSHWGWKRTINAAMT